MRESFCNAAGLLVSRATAAAVLLAGTMACGGDSPSGPDHPASGASVASIEIVPDSLRFTALGQVLHMTATARDAGGVVVPGVSFDWSSADESVARVDDSGGVSAVANGSVTVRAAAGGVAGSATAVVRQRVAAVSLDPGDAALTGVGDSIQFNATAADANGNSVAGMKATWASTDPSIIAVDGNGMVKALAAGRAAVRATVGGIRAYGRLSVAGTAGAGVAWLRLTTAFFNTCGVTTDLVAYCWGNNDHGQLGPEGSTVENTAVPLELDAGVILDGIVPGGAQICALAAGGDAYCLGNSAFGEGGYGSNVHQQITPTRVHGNHAFMDLTAGGNHTCAITTDGDAYCWGLDSRGQLGDGGTDNQNEPIGVAGGHAFVQIEAARSSVDDHTCAVTADGAAYCWGPNDHGELGDGTTEDRNEPVPVQGGHAFSQVSAGGMHSCGITSDGSAFCWGSNSVGQLGDGTTNDSGAPVRVSGGLVFLEISAGEDHTCAIATDQRAYCWGYNSDGQLGDGTKQAHSTPTPVAGNLSFRSIGAGPADTCAASTSGAAYCWGRNDYNRLGSSQSTPSPVRVQEPGT